MPQVPSRREELIAAALTGHLSDTQRREFNQARAADPSIDTELEELRALTKRLKASKVTWREEPLPPDLIARITSETSETDGPTRVNDDDRPDSEPHR